MPNPSLFQIRIVKHAADVNERATDVIKHAADVHKQAQRVNRLVSPSPDVSTSAFGTFGLPSLPATQTAKADLSGLPDQIVAWIKEKRLKSSEGQALAAFIEQYETNRRPIPPEFLASTVRDALVQKGMIEAQAGFFGTMAFVPAPWVLFTIEGYVARKAEGTADFSRPLARFNSAVGLRRPN